MNVVVHQFHHYCDSEHKETEMSFYHPAYDIIQHLSNNPKIPHNLTITVINDISLISNTVYCSVPCANIGEAKGLEGLINCSDSIKISNLTFHSSLNDSGRIWAVLHN